MKDDKFKKIINDLLSKKHIANILVLLAVAIMTLIVSTDVFTKTLKPKATYNDSLENVFVKEDLKPRTDEELVEYRLKNILEKIRGTGEVQVMVTFEMGTEIIPASNVTRSTDTTEEKDSGGGTRIIASENIVESIVVTNETNGNKPLVLKEIKPQINGVIVVADGAEDIIVKERLYDAVKTVLQIPGHKVQVYSKK